MNVQSGRLQARIIKRSQGRSVVAAAAYRAGEALTHAATQEVFDYRRRHRIEATAIFAPRDAPDWVQDRERLWNTVEATEKRHDAQLARELQIALPAVLSADARRDLVWNFCRDHIVPLGMVCDIALHGPGKGDDRNHHAHVLLTTRSLSADGFGNKARQWNENAILDGWKKAWEAACNAALAQEEHDIRIDLRSLALRRQELLDQAEVTDDAITRRRLMIAAERLNYIPRPYLPPKIYEAMVDGRDTIQGKPVTDQQRAHMALWQDAIRSREEARARADEMEKVLEAEIAGKDPAARDEALLALFDGITTADDATATALAVLSAQPEQDLIIALVLDDLGLRGEPDPRSVQATIRKTDARKRRQIEATLSVHPVFEALRDAATQIADSLQRRLPRSKIIKALPDSIRKHVQHALTVVARLIVSVRNKPQEAVTAAALVTTPEDVRPRPTAASRDAENTLVTPPKPPSSGYSM